ncbi:MAG: hypothetical protein AB7F22_07875 [Reyranella sp.]|uniref:hypothetical protein n=1 Tax=Reyranella sp. TaxID=1929291 RepID=UPI003D0EC9EC
MNLFGNKYSLYNIARFEGEGGGNNAPVKTWTEGLDTELVGHAQNRGWATLDPGAAAQAALKAHREAEKLIGVPAEQIIRLPKPEDTAAWEGVHQRLGKPKEAKEYDFADVKFADGTVPDQGFVDAIRNAAFTNNLSKPAAKELAKAVVKYMDAEDATEKTTREGELAAEKTKLRDSWGKNYDAFQVVAKRTAEALGITEQQITALEGTVGYAAVMSMMHTIGTKIGEDSFIQKGPNGTGAMSKEQAVARKNDLQNDADWRTRYLNGGVKEKQEMEALIRIIAG